MRLTFKLTTQGEFVKSPNSGKRIIIKNASHNIRWFPWTEISTNSTKFPQKQNSQDSEKIRSFKPSRLSSCATMHRDEKIAKLVPNYRPQIFQLSQQVWNYGQDVTKNTERIGQRRQIMKISIVSYLFSLFLWGPMIPAPVNRVPLKVRNEEGSG